MSSNLFINHFKDTFTIYSKSNGIARIRISLPLMITDRLRVTSGPVDDSLEYEREIWLGGASLHAKEVEGDREHGNDSL
ncbi:hypothetical protein QYF36_011797 [Acer negundo]|nr:hypothetical protein QYF36_011797 [Acer negundo]